MKKIKNTKIFCFCLLVSLFFFENIHAAKSRPLKRSFRQGKLGKERLSFFTVTKKRIKQRSRDFVKENRYFKEKFVSSFALKEDLFFKEKEYKTIEEVFKDFLELTASLEDIEKKRYLTKEKKEEKLLKIERRFSEILTNKREDTKFWKNKVKLMREYEHSREIFHAYFFSLKESLVIKKGNVKWEVFERNYFRLRTILKFILIVERMKGKSGASLGKLGFALEYYESFYYSLYILRSGINIDTLEVFLRKIQEASIGIDFFRHSEIFMLESSK